MPTEPDSPRLSEVAHRAVQICDPPGEQAELERFMIWFEDRDEPISAIPDLEAEVAEATTAIDPEGDVPAVAMAAAVTTYLGFRRDEIADDREDVLRLAARAEFDAHPPPPVADWLAAQGVALR